MKFGFSPKWIQETDLSTFDRMYDENKEPFDEWLEYAENVFDRQERLGIKTISCQDDAFPHLLQSIGNDAPPLIHLLGDISL